MIGSDRPLSNALLLILAWFLLACAGVSLLAGGFLLDDLYKIGRFYGEMIAFVVAILVGSLGLAAKQFADDLDQAAENKILNDDH